MISQRSMHRFEDSIIQPDLSEGKKKTPQIRRPESRSPPARHTPLGIAAIMTCLARPLQSLDKRQDHQTANLLICPNILLI